MNKFLKTMKRFGYISIETVIVAAIMIVAIFTFLGAFVEKGQIASNDAASKIDDVLNLAGGGEGAGPGGSGGGAGGGEIPEIPDEEEEEEVVTGEAYALILDNSGDSSNAVPMIFVRSETPIAAGDTYNSKTYGNLPVTAAFSGFEDNENKNQKWISYTSTITNVSVENKISPENTSYWFNNCVNVKEFNLTKLDTSNVTDMQFMFASASKNVDSVSLIGLNNWNTSKVTKMNQMFSLLGYDTASSIYIGNLSNWNTSSVTTMDSMFKSTGNAATSLVLEGVEDWNVSQVTNMSDMFVYTGYSDTDFFLNLSSWTVQLQNNVTHYNFNYNVESKVLAPTWK